MLSIYRAGEIDLFENLDIVHIRLLVDLCTPTKAVSEQYSKKVHQPGAQACVGAWETLPC